jgi:hypothetical protein
VGVERFSWLTEETFTGTVFKKLLEVVTAVHERRLHEISVSIIKWFPPVPNNFPRFFFEQFFPPPE